MKRFSLLIFLVSTTVLSYGQNKTLGVGTPTPNSNAALHVESPGNNQGFIMPRLTTTQRTAMGSLLTPTDSGLMLYDTDLKTIYIWDGAAWKSTAQVAGGSKLSYPYKDSVTTNPGSPDLFALKYSGTDNARVMRIENLSFTNGSSVLSVNNQGVGLGGYFQVNNAAGGTALYGTTNSNVGGALAPVGVYGESTGTGSSGGSFRITNAANTYSALYSETNGTGPAFYANKIGNGQAARFVKANGTGAAVYIDSKSGGGLFANHSGPTGYAGIIQTIDTTNTSAGLYAETAGTGASIWALKSTDAVSGDALLAENWIATGSAGKFSITNAANDYPSLYAETSGTGGAFMAKQKNAVSGNAGYFEISNAANPGSSIYAKTFGTGTAIGGLTTGTGTAGVFEISNAGNTQEALRAQTNGSGAAIFANNNGGGYGIYARAIGNTDAIYAEKQATDGPGSAGNFWNSNASNGASVLFAATNAGAGTALGLMNTVDGNALTIFQGGIQVSSVSISSAGPIAAKAGLYEISVAGTFTLPASGSVGETCLVSNTSGSTVTISGSSVLTSTVRQFIRLTGGWQIVN